MRSGNQSGQQRTYSNATFICFCDLTTVVRYGGQSEPIRQGFGLCLCKAVDYWIRIRRILLWSVVMPVACLGSCRTNRPRASSFGLKDFCSTSFKWEIAYGKMADSLLLNRIVRTIPLSD
ncbi:uncharacterized protein LOC129751488 [Uranotaenia lowii]|uniref:uncharacterized protein LOC129751488 n=1 Tax=Uranotaenia lowii TaxID=190385 RepID=UPI002478EF43|nr:uncharacterized protein LOC129751488 [Uranotaenia lowii]